MFRKWRDRGFYSHRRASLFFRARRSPDRFGESPRAFFFAARRRAISRGSHFTAAVDFLKSISFLGCGRGWFRRLGSLEKDGSSTRFRKLIQPPPTQSSELFDHSPFRVRIEAWQRWGGVGQSFPGATWFEANPECSVTETTRR